MIIKPVFKDIQSTKDSLSNLYEELRIRALGVPTSLVQRLGCPMLSFPRDRWYQSTHRIMIIMQEPFNWGFDTGLHYYWSHPKIWSFAEFRDYQHSVKALTIDAYVPQVYELYELESTYRPTPATKAIDLFLDYSNSTTDTDVVTNNLFKCILNTNSHKSPLCALESDRNQLLRWQHDCLRQEVMIIKPTAVVFLTGPYYDEILKHEFPGVEFQKVTDNRDVRQFAKVIHSDLPDKSFRTYHPGYLARSRKSPWLRELLEFSTR